MTRVLLVGNPNCGKTTLFNALTGENQRVGNWPGVTVEKKTGVFQYQYTEVNVTDLPGVYSLTTNPQGSSLDEQITANALLEEMDVIVNVMDACHFERHLYLTSQLLELGKPLILVLNMMDIATDRGITIDVQALSEQLQCHVVTLQAHRQIGIDALKQAIIMPRYPNKPILKTLPEQAKQAYSDIEKTCLTAGKKQDMIPYLIHRMLESDEALDVLMADARYTAIHAIALSVQKKRSDTSEHMTAKIDRIVLHRYVALPIFLGVMYGLFFFAIQVGGVFQEWFDTATDAMFVRTTATWLTMLHAPNWLISLLAHGVGKGINTTLTFIPVIASMYFFLSLLETSGYMARAAFIVDKMMRFLGLPGKAFVPMIVGFGCNVPAIMAARTLDSEQDRLLTILMSPFMSCSARLAIYAIFVAAFFPTGGQNIVFSLYLIGVGMAVLTGLLLRRTVFRGQASPLIIELPAYHVPSMKRLLKETMLRLRHFVIRAGKLILPVCVILGGLNTLTIHGGLNTLDASSDSILALLGQWLTPLFAPMGVHHDNWPATVGLLTGTLAKEVVVGSLNSLYAQMGHLADTNSVYGMMYQQFDGKIGAYAYMLFILLYIPCVSTMAVIRQEASRRLMWFSIVWSLVVAYAASVSFYQIATLMRHPLTSILWGCAMIGLVGLSVLLIRMMAKGFSGASYAASTS